MSSTSATKKYLLIPVWILLAAVIVLGVVQSGKPANLIDPAGFLFVLFGGIALVLISFPGVEIRRALRDAFAAPGDEEDIRSSAHFWEAAARGFWIAGVLRSILSFVMFFQSLRTQPIAPMQVIYLGLAQYLLATLYGVLLAVICLIPCWKLIGNSERRPSESTIEHTPSSTARSGRRISAAIGY